MFAALLNIEKQRLDIERTECAIQMMRVLPVLKIPAPKEERL